MATMPAVAALETSLAVASVLCLLISGILVLQYRRTARYFELRFRTLVDAVPEYAIFMLDVRGNVASWNAGAKRLMGFDEAEIVGKHFSTFFIGEDVAQRKPEEQIRLTIEKGRLERSGWHLRKDGSRFWADVAMAVTRDSGGKLTGFSKVIRDSTDRKHDQDVLAASATELDRRVREASAELIETNRVLRQEVERRSQTEASLRHSEAVARGMFETAVDAIITIDAAGKIASFNPAAQRLFGYTATEVIGRNVSTLMPQPYRREHDSYLERYKTTGNRRIIGIGREVIAQRKDGTTFPIDLAVGEQQVDGRLIFTGFIRDITERKRLESEILEIAEREQQRIGQDLHDSLGQLLTGVTFLVKSLESQLIERGLPEASQATKIGELLAQSVSQARALSRGLQPLDDPEELPMALEHLCESSREVFGVECRLNLESKHSPQISGLLTATHIYRIAQEAVNNAIRHGKARKIDITLRSVYKGIELIIEDNGVGFGAERGTGIGLRTMRHRARTLGGDIEVGPGVNGGLVVRCMLSRIAE
jgi:PAS domain S-box-containing protein